GHRYAEFFEGCDACRHGQRVSTQRARLINRPQWRQVIHDVRMAAERPDWQPAADDLSKTTQVRRNVKPLLRAAPRETKSRHDFIEDQQGAFGRGYFAQEIKVT